jgi:hypothetical protein
MFVAHILVTLVEHALTIQLFPHMSYTLILHTFTAVKRQQKVNKETAIICSASFRSKYYTHRNIKWKLSSAS